MRKTITIRVNGIAETHDVEPNRTLLEFLRDDLNLTGAKEGCNEGECGACMVLVEGRAMNSCLVLAAEMDGREITTIEGLSDGPHLHPLQRAFLAHSAVQCGFCTPGMIITAFALLQENPNPTEADVRRALSGCMCRCTGYRQIIDSVLDAAAVLRGNGEDDGRAPRDAQIDGRPTACGLRPTSEDKRALGNDQVDRRPTAYSLRPTSEDKRALGNDQLDRRPTAYSLRPTNQVPK